MSPRNASTMRFRTALGGVTALAALFVAGCNGSSTTPAPVVAVATATPAATPTPAPTATPAATPLPSGVPAAIGGSAVSLQLTTVGSSAQFTVTESSYTGPLTAANGTPSCAGIATFAPAAGTGPSATFTVTAVAAGQCTIVMTDNHGGSVGVNVAVTTTSGTVSRVHRQTQ
jgi:hypothetical protein